MRLKCTRIWLCLIIICLAASRGDCRPGGMPGTGVVSRVDQNSLVISFENGTQREVRKDASVSCVRSENTDVGDLEPGSDVTVIGFASDRTIRARLIIAGDAPQGGGRDIHAGTLARVNPPALRTGTGEILTLEILPRTVVIKEIPMPISSLAVGDRVRLTPDKIVVMQPFPNQPMDRDRRPTEDNRPYRSEGGPGYGNREDTGYSGPGDTLLSDLPQQPVNPDFIYGAWLGRGQYSNRELDRGFRLAKNLGVRYLKVEFKWGYLQSRNRDWNWTNDGVLDVAHVISLARQYHFSIIPYFNTFMPWGDRRQVDPRKGECDGPPSRWGQVTAPDPDAYATYVFSVIDRLKKGGVHVAYAELDNEVSVMIDDRTSWNCFIDVTPRQLKEAENRAYEKVKARYPEILISSTTFNSPGMALEENPETINKFISRLNRFVAAYFEEAPKPKFDFLGVHEIFRGSGNPFTTDYTRATGDGYDFSSYYDTYDIWRSILDKYGYGAVPIFVTESLVKHRGLQDVELLQKVVFARTQAGRNNIRGWVLSQLTGSKTFTEGRSQGQGSNAMRRAGPRKMPRAGGQLRMGGGQQRMGGTQPSGPGMQRDAISFGIAAVGDNYSLKEGYYAFYTMMTTLARYPFYEKRIMGELNSRQPWIEQFTDPRGNVLYTAFISWDLNRQGDEKRIRLRVGKNRTVWVTKSDTTRFSLESDAAGDISLQVSQHPVFIEVKRDAS